jgi:AcrR family transcriptional regulator
LPAEARLSDTALRTAITIFNNDHSFIPELIMGRHREFELDDALDAALQVFWSKGYEGTSFTDLVDATNVARPGLYSAFGNKEELFYKVLDRYENRHLRFMSDALELPTASEVIKAILYGCAKVHTQPSKPKGCLVVNGAIVCSDESEAIRSELAKRRDLCESALKARLQQAKTAGELCDGEKPVEVARYVMTVVQGMSIQARAGASRKQLLAVADLSLRGLTASFTS